MSSLGYRPAVHVAGHKSNLRLLVRRPGALARKYHPALLLALIGATLDGLTTYRMLTAFGHATELHLVVRLVVWIVGVPAGVPLAMIAKTACAILVACIWRRWCECILNLYGLTGIVGAICNHFNLL